MKRNIRGSLATTISVAILAAFILTTANEPAAVVEAHHFDENAVVNSCRVSDRNPDDGDRVTISAKVSNIRADDENDRAKLWVTFEAYQQSRLIKKFSTSTKTVQVGKSYTFRRNVTAGGSFLPTGDTTAIVCGLHRQNRSLGDTDEDHADAGNVTVRERNLDPVIDRFSPRDRRIDLTPGDYVRKTFEVAGHDQNGNLDRLVWKLTSDPDYSNTPQERVKSWENGSLYFDETETFTIHRKAGSRFTVTARIFDDDGAKDIVEWRIVVAEDDDPDNPPELRRIEPPGIHKTLLVNQRHRFQIESRDDDEDLEVGATFSSQGRVSGTCSTIGDSASFQSGCEYSFSDAGDYRVEATVEDASGNSANTYWRVTVENPPPACAASRISPTDHDLDIEEGTHRTFKVKIDCGTEWNLRWYKNSSVRHECGHNQACRITFRERGRSEIEATIFLDGGRRTHTIIWYITVRAKPANRPPVVNASSPDSPLTLTASDSQVFSASIEDPDGDAISSRWEINGEKTTNIGYSYTHNFPRAGRYTVAAIFTDPNGAAVSVNWAVVVEAEEVAPPPPPPPICNAIRVAPADRDLTIEKGEYRTFIVDITCDGWDLSWHQADQRLVNCRDNTSCGNSFHEESEKIQIKAEFTKDGAKKQIVWIITVKEPDTPPPPTCDAIRKAPSDRELILDIGQYRTFIVDITCDGWNLSWHQDDDRLVNCGSNTSCGNSFHEESEKIQIKAEFTKDGAKKQIVWIIRVQEEDEVAPPPPPDYPPDLEIQAITINGTKSPDRFSVGESARIRVVVRNDGDGDADSSEVCMFVSRRDRVSSSVDPTLSRSVKSIDADDDEGVSFYYTFTEEDAGERYIIAHVDCDDELDEDSENNNSGYLGPITVAADDVVPPDGNCQEKTDVLIDLDSSAKNLNEIITFNVPAEYREEVREDFEELKRGIEAKSSSYEIRNSIEDGNEIILIWAGHGREERFILCANPYDAAFSYLAPPHAIPIECKEAAFDFVADQILGIIYLIHMLGDSEDRIQIIEFLRSLGSATAPSYILTGMQEAYDLMINGGDIEDLKSSYTQKLNDDFTFVGDLAEGIFVSIVEPITTSWDEGDYLYAACRGAAEVADFVLIFTPTPLGKTKVVSTVTKADLIANGAKVSSKSGKGVRCLASDCLLPRLQNQGFTQQQAEEIIDAIAESGRDYDTVVKLIEDSDRRVLEQIQNLGADDAIVKEFISGRLSGEGVFSHMDIWREFKDGGRNIKVEQTEGKADYFIPQPSSDSKIIIEVKSIHSDSGLASTLNANIEKAVEQLRKTDSGLSGNRGVVVIDVRDSKLDNLPAVKGLHNGGNLYDRLEDFISSQFYSRTNQGFLDNIIMIIPKKDLPEWKRVVSYRYNPKSGVLSHRRIDTVNEALDY